MIRAIVALCALSLSVPGLCWAQGATNPTYAKKYQGTAKAGTPKPCATASGVLVDGDGDRMQWTAKAPSSGSVYICCDTTFLAGPTASPTPAPCPTGNAQIVLDSQTPAYTEETSAKARCRFICDVSTGTVRVTESK